MEATEDLAATADAIVKRESDRFKGKIIAFTPVSSHHSYQPEHPWAVGIAVLGEAGYSLPRHWDVYAEYKGVAARCDSLNTILGLEDRTAIAIVADTMNRSNFKRDQEQGLTAVKFTQQEIKDLITCIEEGLSDAHLADVTGRLEAALD